MIARAGAGPARLGDKASYRLIGYGITVLIATGTVPIGLFPLYASEFSFSPAVTTLLAAATMFGITPAVLFFGPLSDRVGRRPLLVPAVLLAAVSLIVFLVSQNVAGLLAARILNGFAVGLYTGAGTAALTELEPSGDSRRAATHAATTSVVGFSLGPLIGGVFGEFGPWPLRLVYVAGLALLLPALVGAILMRETVDRQPFAMRLQRLGVPRSGLRVFALASLVAVCAFMTASFFQSLGTTIVTRVLEIDNLAIAGAVVMCFLGASAMAQVRFRGMRIRLASLCGLVVLPSGVALVVAALVLRSLELFLLGALIGGAGQGLAYLGGQSLVELVAPAERRGEVFSAYLIVVYYGGGLTAITLGLAAKEWGLQPASVVYALAACALSLCTAGLVWRSQPPSERVEPMPAPPAV